MSVLANEILFKIFRTPNSVMFLKEYEKHSLEFQKIFSDSFEDDNSIDYFFEYIRPFISKKQKVI